ncbi:MAG: GNAT family N-acetyltransferase [Thermoanaerobaculia bacterium]
MTVQSPSTVQIRPVGAGEAAVFSAMTFPAYRHMLSLERTVRLPQEHDSLPVDPIAVAAIIDGTPAGLAVGELPVLEDHLPEVLSLFVAPQFRGHGIATQLLARMEEEVRSRGFERLLGIYMTGKSGVDAFEHIAAKRGWSEPHVRMVSCRFSAESLASAPWLGKYHLPSDYEIFPWSELREEERETLRRSHAENPWIAPDLLPWEYEKFGFEPKTSLGIRYKGVVVGWILNHQLADDTVRYTCSYIRKDLGRLGRIVPAYSESFRRFIEAGFRNATFTTPLHHKGMAAFAKRWFAPWSTFFGETRGIEKSLGSDQSNDRSGL